MEELSPKRESAANPDPLKRGKQSFKVKKVSAQSMIIESSRRTSTFDDKTKLQKAIDAFYLEDESMVSDIEELTADERNDLVILKEQLALEKENKNQGKKSETGRVQKNQHSGKKSEKAEKGSFAGFSRFYRGMFPTKAHFNLFRTFPRVVDNLERPIRWKKTGDSNEKIAAIIIFNSNKRMWKESLERKVFGSVKDFLQNKKFYENGHLIRTEDGDEEDEENVCEEEEEEEDELGEREERLQERVRKEAELREREERLQERVRKEAELREREERLQERVRKEAELREREERLQERVRKEAELLREREERLQERVRKEAELLQRVRKEVELLREREERLQEREERLREREERLREREERIQQEESRKIKVTEARRNPEGTNKRSETMNHNELTKEFHHHRLGTTSSVSKMKFFDQKTPKPE